MYILYVCLYLMYTYVHSIFRKKLNFVLHINFSLCSLFITYQSACRVIWPSTLMQMNFYN